MFRHSVFFVLFCPLSLNSLRSFVRNIHIYATNVPAFSVWLTHFNQSTELFILPLLVILVYICSTLVSAHPVYFLSMVLFYCACSNAMPHYWQLVSQLTCITFLHFTAYFLVAQQETNFFYILQIRTEFYYLFLSNFHRVSQCLSSKYLVSTEKRLWYEFTLQLQYYIPFTHTQNSAFFYWSLYLSFFVLEQVSNWATALPTNGTLFAGQ